MSKIDNNFNFFVEADFEKSNKPKGEDSRYDNMIIWGMSSDNSEDSDEEVLEPEGYILDRFLKAGTLNYEHQAKTSSKYIIGEPIDAQIKDNQFYIKGKLWKGRPIAEDLWDTLHIMKDNKSTRKLGWSIEGKALTRDPNNPKRITKALITNVALTFSPKNKNTWANIVKGEYTEPYIEPEFDETANGGSEYLLDVTRPDGTQITVDKDFNIKIGKAMSAGSATGTELTGKNTNGASLKRESLRRKLTNLQPESKDIILKMAKNKKNGKWSKEMIEKSKIFIKNLF